MAPVTNYCLLLLAAVAALHLIDAAEDSGKSGSDPPPDEYPVCAEMYQSPIDIEPHSTVYGAQYANLAFTGYDTTPSQVSFKLINNGHTAQVNLVNNTGLISISGSELPSNYILEQFHFHWGSDDTVGAEHTINGHAYAMELHLVHYNSQLDNVSYASNQTEGLAVLGVFVEVGGENNTAFSKFVDYFDQIAYAEQEADINTFSLDGLLPSNKADYYRYNGSLTTAPCYQSVIWTVFKEPIAISDYQIKAFRNLYHNKRGETPEKHIVDNFRPIKPLNGRTVYRTYEDLGTTTASADETTTAGSSVFAYSGFVLLHSALLVYLASKLAN